MLHPFDLTRGGMIDDGYMGQGPSLCHLRIPSGFLGCQTWIRGTFTAFTAIKIMVSTGKNSLNHLKPTH
jgi:hypothetical protein